MEIRLTWHLLVMIVITVILIIRMFKTDGGLDMSFGFFGIILVVIWLIYGGIVLW